MRPIKFRGKNADGTIYYGDLVTCYKNAVAIAFKNEDGDLTHAPVAPESVAQLVGYDEDGNEVYEGDELISNLNPDYVVKTYFSTFPEQDSATKPDTFVDWKLKKE